MATEALVVADTIGADSAPITLAAGVSAKFVLKGIVGKALVAVRVQDDTGAYQEVGNLDGLEASKRGITIDGPCTFLFTRRRGTCGVSRA